MTEEKTFRINLPTLFERVNERRREQGLPQVEPAMMAIRASIKFAIRQQKHMDLKGEKVDLVEAEANALCQTLGDLFNVDLHLDQDIAPTTGNAPALPDVPAATAAQESEADDDTRLVLPLFHFYASINRERRAKCLQPAEPAVISVRTGIKFSILRRRTLNFQGDKLLLNRTDLRVLDSIIAQQFDVYIPGGLVSLCKAQEGDKPAADTSATAPQPGSARDLIARVLAFFRAEPRGSPTSKPQIHQYTLDTNNLLISIITRRAYLGHKPITPDKVKDRCGKALSAELELEVDLNDKKLNLNPEQIDAFAQAIRKEFDIMFEDLDDLLGKKPRP
jgi:hypothetical protein